ncbi:unnamed protein product [Prorocentrum cordatum]|uniref:Uncharacterized protein n=1 Tax=Prorocentrum cordatum TaxID=2364126 RepID=A0ABN9VNS4_9DINO|nr:unnamed protein product [Polarella glacialis]
MGQGDGTGAAPGEQRRPHEPPLAPGSWQTFLVDGARGRALEAQLLAAGGQGKGEACVEGAEDAGAPGQELADAGHGPVLQTYYDSAAWNLTRRGWWLLESQGAWTLHVPQFAPDGDGGHRLQGYEQVREDAEILDKMGLTEHAKALREGWGGSATMTVLLSQASVVPFAQLLVEHVTCRARLGPGVRGAVDAGGGRVRGAT